ncbi:unnamed protein product [marine sediment metagenome]|uniref:Uncharacterized protein n=1 Tax=marine sediment metagenome TaxID=412755 RepID=X0YCU2_9ZZZZ
MKRYRRELVCPKESCKYTWIFKGKKPKKQKKYTSCPVCHGSVKINQKRMPEEVKK